MLTDREKTQVLKQFFEIFKLMKVGLDKGLSITPNSEIHDAVNSVVDELEKHVHQKNSELTPA